MATWIIVGVLVYLCGVQADWVLKNKFEGTPADNSKDLGKTKIDEFFTVSTYDSNNGYADAYVGSAGNDNLYIDESGYLVIQPTCPTKVDGQCKAVQCNETMLDGKVCPCTAEVWENKWFPTWCQQGWHSGRLLSKPTFQFSGNGTIIEFQDLWIPRGRPLWPAVWLLPETDPRYGGQGAPMGGTWSKWPSNGEIDILETIGTDPNIFGTLHYTTGAEAAGYPTLKVTANSSATRGTAYNTSAMGLMGNILAERKTGNAPTREDGHIGTLCFHFYVDDVKGATMKWYVADGNSSCVQQGKLAVRDQLDVMINREGTDPIRNITGDGSGSLNFESTPFWPGVQWNSPKTQLMLGDTGKGYAYSYQGFYRSMGNVQNGPEGIHTGAVSPANPKGLGIVPTFNGSKPIPGTIEVLYEPYLCSMMGDQWDGSGPLPWPPVKCENPPPGYTKDACPRTGQGSPDTYDYCFVKGATRPGVGWYSASPLAKATPFAPFDTLQKWNLILNIEVGGDWPRVTGEDGWWDKNYPDITKTNLRMRSINVYNQEE